jgi:hypothetical protein
MEIVKISSLSVKYRRNIEKENESVIEYLSESINMLICILNSSIMTTSNTKEMQAWYVKTNKIRDWSAQMIYWSAISSYSDRIGKTKGECFQFCLMVSSIYLSKWKGKFSWNQAR